MKYSLKKRIIYSILIAAMLFGFGYIAYFGIDENGSGSASDIKLGLDLAGGVSITYQTVDENPDSQDLTDTIYKLQKRVENYSSEAQVYKEGGRRITVEIPDVSDANKILEELGTPGSLEFRDAKGNVLLTGTDVKSASAYTDKTNTSSSTPYGVSLQFTDEGAQKFYDATAANIGSYMSTYYDGVEVNTARISQAISGGSAVIEGMDSYDEANKLSTYIRIGSIPCELEEISSNVVAAQLGNEAIDISLMATAIGLLLIFAFMMIFYRLPGVAASLALIIYTGMVVILVSVYEITLTLPGIAGIILSIGMAVDANIIIYSRIKEEIGNGKAIDAAINLGFHKALSAIIDGNVTTIIAALILWFKGSGGVRGFAETLAIGVIVSMFTAIFVSRTIIKLFYSFGLSNPKLYGATTYKKTYNFVKHRFKYLLVSAVIIVAGFAFMAFNAARDKGALSYSLEFVGGTVTTVTFNQDYSQSEIDSDIIPAICDAVGVSTVQQQKVNDSNKVIFKTQTLTLAQRESFNTEMVSRYGVDESLITSESISSTVSDGMKKDAIIAVVLSIVCMLIYIWFRFKDVKFATSAVIALAVDLLFLLAFYSFSRIAVGNTFVACMLTILGYSINATIIIFDRIRENLATADSKTDIANLVNVCITETLTRSINTNSTVFLMLLVLFVCGLGLGSITEFALPLMVGVAGGTYSSIFITGGLWYSFREWSKKRAAKKAK